MVGQDDTTPLLGGGSDATNFFCWMFFAALMGIVTATAAVAGASLLLATDHTGYDVGADALAAGVGAAILYCVFFPCCFYGSRSSSELSPMSVKQLIAAVGISSAGAAIGSGIFGENAAHVVAAAAVGTAVVNGAIVCCAGACSSSN